VKRPFALALGGAAMGASFACTASVTSVGAYVEHVTPTDAAAHPAAVSDAIAPTPGLYVEAESGALSGGFTIGSDATASGGHYIEAPIGVRSTTAPGAARALYTVTIAEPGTYVIWGRIHSPDAEHNSLWAEVDAGTWYHWRISTGDVFYWDELHDDTNYGVPLTFDFDAGSHELVLANADDTVQLDRLYFTASGDEPPGNDDTPCHPPNSIQQNGVCVPSCGSQGGTTCGADGCSGLPAIPSYDCVVCCAK
jgi:hypothetical protein